MFSYGVGFRTKVFFTRNPKIDLIAVQGIRIILVFLFNFRERKVLWVRTFNNLDILPLNRFEELVGLDKVEGNRRI